MMLQKRSLGRSEIRVVPWCLGGNVFGWTADEKTSFELLDAFVDAGFDFIDTADVYSSWVPGHKGGESETVIGNWLASRKNRDRVVIATKLGMGQPGRNGRLDRAYVAESIEGSLKRLRTDYVDLYQSHRDDEATPQEETLQAYADLIKAGKVRIIGASNFSAARLGSALEISVKLGLPRYETLQPQYNLADRAAFESELMPLCLAQDIGVIPYYALGAGFLTGKYRSEADFGKSPRGGGMSRYLNARGLGILAALDTVSGNHEVEPAAVAIAWLMAQPTIAAPIASATSLPQLRTIAAGADVVLSAADPAVLDQAAA